MQHLRGDRPSTARTAGARARRSPRRTDPAAARDRVRPRRHAVPDAPRRLRARQAADLECARRESASVSRPRGPAHAIEPRPTRTGCQRTGSGGWRGRSGHSCWPGANGRAGEVERRLWTSSAKLDAATLGTLAELRERDMAMALVTNGSSAMRGLADTLGLRLLLRDSLLSCEVGVVKPRQGIYRKALAKLELPASECIYVGDGSDREAKEHRQSGCSPSGCGLWPSRRTALAKA